MTDDTAPDDMMTIEIRQKDLALLLDAVESYELYADVVPCDDKTCHTCAETRLSLQTIAETILDAAPIDLSEVK
jgi:hypothetical protein